MDESDSMDISSDEYEHMTVLTRFNSDNYQYSGIIKVADKCFGKNLRVYDKVLGKGTFGTVFLTCSLPNKEENPDECSLVIKVQVFNKEYYMRSKYRSNRNKGITRDMAKIGLDDYAAKKYNEFITEITQEASIQSEIAAHTYTNTDRNLVNMTIPVIPTIEGGIKYRAFTCRDETVKPYGLDLVMILMPKLDSSLKKYIEKYDNDTSLDAMVKHRDMAENIISLFKAAKKNKFFHGDTKPDNIGIYEGNPIFIDFGASKFNYIPMSQKDFENQNVFSWVRVSPEIPLFADNYDAISMYIYLFVFSEDRKVFTSMLLDKLTQYLNESDITVGAETLYDPDGERVSVIVFMSISDNTKMFTYSY